MTDLAAIRERIRKLRQVTAARGATEAEALVAATKARDLLRKHGLDERTLAYGPHEVPLGRARRAIVDDLWPEVAWYCNCASWLQRSRDGRYVVVYFGTPPGPEVAEYVHEVLLAAIRRAAEAFKATQEYRRRRLPKTRSTALRAFTRGMVDGLIGKLRRLKGVYGADEAALQDVRAAMQRQGIELCDLPALARGQTRGMDEARWLGRAAARGVELHQGVRGGRDAGPPPALPGSRPHD